MTVELSLDVFLDDWLPGMQKDGLLVGVNWSGERAKGYDVEPEVVAEAIAYHRRRLESQPMWKRWLKRFTPARSEDG